MIPEEIVEEVRERADIVEVVGEHVRLKKSGKDFKALCPFHKEKTPSFYVVPAKGFYKCFGCGASGDVYSFLMEHVGLDFQEAVRQLAAKVGVEIPEPGRRHAEDPNRALYEAVAFAADYYARTLWDDAAGERARRYLEGRGIDRESAERFRLGCSPAEWRALREAAHGHGIEDDTLLAAGLIKESDRTDEPYDRFRDRLIFPITDARGRVVAFGGRVLDDEDVPKYLNSPETPVYHKGRELYGLYWARTAIRRAESALVVEGYTDYVSLAANGVENVVAPLGTAMTTEQAELLARYTKRALLLYDSDTAGLRATFRTGDALLRAGVHPMVVTLPDGEDPDSVVRDGGAPALERYLDGAVDVVDRKLQILEQRGYLEDVEKLRKALDGLMPTLRATADAALRDIYVARVAERTGVRRRTLERELTAERSGRGRWGAGGRRAGRPGAVGGPDPEARSSAPGVAGQRTLTLLLLRDAAWIARAAEQLEPDDFGDPVYRELFEMLVREGAIEGRDPGSLGLSPEALARLEELRGDPEELYETEKVFKDTVGSIRLVRFRRELEALQERIKTAELTDDTERLTELFRARAELKARLIEEDISRW